MKRFVSLHNITEFLDISDDSESGDDDEVKIQIRVECNHKKIATYHSRFF